MATSPSPSPPLAPSPPLGNGNVDGEGSRQEQILASSPPVAIACPIHWKVRTCSACPASKTASGVIPERRKKGVSNVDARHHHHTIPYHHPTQKTNRVSINHHTIDTSIGNIGSISIVATARAGMPAMMKTVKMVKGKYQLLSVCRTTSFSPKMLCWLCSAPWYCTHHPETLSQGTPRPGTRSSPAAIDPPPRRTGVSQKQQKATRSNT